MPNNSTLADLKRLSQQVMFLGEWLNTSVTTTGPMTRNKDTESDQRMAAEQELKVAEKAREHQVEIETEIEVEKQKAAELKWR